MSQRVDKGSMPCNKPRRTPGHPDKSHVVKACYDGKEKIIRFGEQGASTAGKPKAGESERMTKKRASFKARHAKNIAKGPSSAAYWANRVKWAEGGHVELGNMLADYEGADDVHNLVQKFKTGGQPKRKAGQATISSYEPTLRESAWKKTVDTLMGWGVSKDTAISTADTIVGRTSGQQASLADLTPAGAVFGTQEGAREFKRGVRHGDTGALVSGGLNAGLNALSLLPLVGGAVKGARAVASAARPARAVRPRVMTAPLNRIAESRAPRALPAPEARAALPAPAAREPQTVYHGTRDRFTQFDLEHPNRKDVGWMGRGAYVTDSPELAAMYAQQKRGEGVPRVLEFKVDPGYSVPLTLQQKNEMRFWPQSKIDEWTQAQRDAGFNSSTLTFPSGEREIAVFDPTTLEPQFSGVKMMKRPASFPVDYGRPEGNFNLRPSIDPVTLKGAEVQDIDSLINQLRGRPGVTKEGLETVAKGFQPGERVTAAQFGERMPRSQYGRVDLAQAVDDANEHLRQEAIHMVDQDDAEVYGRLAEDLGLNYSDGAALRDIHLNGTDFADPDTNILGYLGEQFGTDDATRVARRLDDAYHDVRSDAIQDTFERLQDYAPEGMFDDQSGYSYRDYQRLVSDDATNDPGYFEVGVTHPDIGDLDFESVDYRGGHYPKAENLAGHIRGTFNPEALLSGAVRYDPDMSPATAAQLMAGEARRNYGFTPKPNSMVIEELQSDVGKEFGQTGPLHQIHGTLFKGAIQHALEGGADTVYLPTSNAVALTRFADPSAYAPIYDKEVIKYGLNPLREIPGVTVNPIDDMYHEITISPEARDYILTGPGQKTPGYAHGGLVSSYDEAKVSNLADQIREGIYG